ncbi:MAG: efflux RND transporter permease subunit [Desulfovibrio sp.]|nr:MAG: efflux RND transporter permease subunit [Desulfovibrio sp.]
MIINQAALKRQVTVIVLVLLIILAGASSYMSLPREDSPDITIPYVFVTTTYEGVAPEDMETLITIPLERKLKGLSDVEEIRSESDDGVSSISIEFLPSVDIDDALQKVRDKVDQAKSDLPDDLPNDPVISEANFSEFPILQVVLSGPFSLKRLKVFAEDIEDRIESIEGVLEADVIGGLEREIHVEFDLDRVAFYDMPFSSLVTAVQHGNVNQPGGSMDIGEGKYLVRVPEDFQHPSEIDSIVAFVRDGSPVYLRDVATIRDHYADPTSISRIDGMEGVTIQVKKRSGENIIRIVDEVEALIEEMRPELPPTLNIDLTANEAQNIKMMVEDLENNILTGLVLVLIVVFLFIGGRSAVFVAAAIPLSMLITFAMLEAFGITLNIVVLFSLTLALGMLVDNGIVIVENIYRHMQEGMTKLEAARAATDEVAWPVITSTLTTAGAFFPLIFWPGIMGEFMSYLPRTVIIALLASLFVALVVNPVLSARYQTVKPLKGGDSSEQAALTNLSLSKRVYRAMLRWSLRHRFIVIFLSFCLLIGSIWAFGKYGNGMEFFPTPDPRTANINIEAPVGTNLDTTDVFARQVEDLVIGYDENIRHVLTSVGEGGGGLGGGGGGTHTAVVTLDFREFQDRTRSSQDIVDEIRELVTHEIVGAEVRVENEQQGPPTGDPVNMEISGEDIHVLGDLTDQVVEIIKEVPGVVDLEDNFIRGKPEITVEVDKEKAALLNLDAYIIAYTVKSAINGVKVGVFREGKDEYDIVARLPEQDRQSVGALQRLTVSGTNGEPVPLTSVASVQLTSGLGGINRKDQKRVVTISSNVSGRLANEVIMEIEERLQDFNWPRGYSYRFTGEQEEQAKAMAFLSKAFVACVFIIFLVLVTQFNSAATPFIILTSVMLSLIGVFLGLLITGMPFGVIMTGVGVISLAGVVVNNAIVLIDYFNQLKGRGLTPNEALERAGLVRFRPVLLTAITTILGLLPMATAVSFNFIQMELVVGGESAQWWGPMAVAVIFGLTVATMLTLIVVPVLCSTLESWNSWSERRNQRKRDRRERRAQKRAERQAQKEKKQQQKKGYTKAKDPVETLGQA